MKHLIPVLFLFAGVLSAQARLDYVALGDVITAPTQIDCTNCNAKTPQINGLTATTKFLVPKPTGTVEVSGTPVGTFEVTKANVIKLKGSCEEDISGESCLIITGCGYIVRVRIKYDWWNIPDTEVWASLHPARVDCGEEFSFNKPVSAFMPDTATLKHIFDDDSEGESLGNKEIDVQGECHECDDPQDAPLPSLDAHLCAKMLSAVR